MPLRAVALDFDGTIADTEPLHYEAYRLVLGGRGITLTETFYYERYLAGTDRECVERMIADFHRPDLAPEAAAILAEKLALFDQLLERTPRLFAGVAEFLGRAAAFGPLAIVTGSVAKPVHRFLDATGLAPRFSIFVTAEDVAAGKPDPAGYTLAWRRLREAGLDGLDAGHCLAVEDAPSGIIAARAAGMRTLALAHSRPAAELHDADSVASGYGAVDWRKLAKLFAAS